MEVAAMDPSVGGKQASSNGQYGEIAGVECDGDVHLSVSVTVCVLLFRFPIIIQPDGRKFRRGRRICV